MRDAPKAISPGRVANPAAPPLSVSILLSVGLILLMALVRLRMFGSIVLPVGYGVPLVILAWTRNRTLLWITAAVFVAMNCYKFLYLQPGLIALHVANEPVNLAAVMIDLLCVAWVVDAWIRWRNFTAAKQEELERRNVEVSAGREEAARHNEALREKAIELERHGQLLRDANRKLAQREQSLQTLLELSRTLNIGLDRGVLMSRICGAAAELLGDPEIAAAIVERSGEEMRLACHSGFGSEGPDVDRVAYGESFGRVAMEQGRTARLEDITLRPDLRCPQPRDVPTMRSVLATPLRVGGMAVATLEIYAPHTRGWTSGETALVESLAAQTSITLEASELFTRIDDEHSQLQTVLETVPFGLCIISRDRQRMRFNTAGAALLRVPQETTADVTAWPIPFTLSDPTETLPVERYPLARALQGESSPPTEMLLRFSDGVELALLVSAAPILAATGAVHGAIAAFVDIGPQKSLREELESRRRKAEEESIRKSRFLAAVSHDIRTPANAISLMSELLRQVASQPDKAGEIPELVSEVHMVSGALVRLVGDVLDITRLDTGRVELHETEFALADLLKDACMQLSPVADQKQLALQCGLAEGLRLRTDRIKLSRVVGNLIANAIKYTERGEVAVTAEVAPDGRLEIRVTDTGVGIEEADRERIFDEFVQLRRPDRDRGTGSGMGLAICRRLIGTMGGELQLQSQVGKGSCFTAILPASAVVGGGHNGHSNRSGNGRHEGDSEVRLDGGRSELTAHRS
jgi:signal transduction histidine kinase/GAF domain-containing protein